MDSTRTVRVTVTYVDTVTRGVGDRVVVPVLYAYCQSYCDMDILTREVGDGVDSYGYCQGYCT